MEVIFGTFANDQLTLHQHRAASRGLQHRHAITPAAPAALEPVTLTVWVGVDTDFDHVACYFTADGSLPVGAYGQGANAGVQVVRFHPVGTEWDNLAWGYTMRYQAVLPGQPDGTLVYYRIGGWLEGGPEVYAEFPDVTRIAENATVAFFKGADLAQLPDPPPRFPDGAVFTYRAGTRPAPAWAREAVMYHVYIDRFYPGDGRSWLQTEDTRQYMGGTLDGARQKLGYLADLGINTIWLSPTWEASSYHGYDITDYFKTSERLGGDAALHRFIDDAHARGMRVLLDLPCNHISNHSALFMEAASSSASLKRDWFTFTDTPPGYNAFFGLASMPELRLSNPVARDWMVDVARYWLREFDADGFRLDYALGPGPDFYTTFAAGCKDVKPDALLLGEVIDSPLVQATYVGRLDGCLDFFANESLRKRFGWATLSEAEFNRTLRRHRAYFPDDFVLPAFLDNHDMNRFLYIAKGDKDALRAAFRTLMGLPNLPIIYYGTEVGLSQTVSTSDGFGLDVSRAAMPWGADQDAALLADCAAAIAERKQAVAR